MTRERISRVLAAGCVALAMTSAACSREAPRKTVGVNGAAPAPTTLDSGPHDDFGRPILFSLHPKRVVSLNPTTTETIFAIGAGSLLIGRSHWDEWPAAAKSVPDMGDGISPNVEVVVAAHPDLVILYASEDNRAAAERR